MDFQGFFFFEEGLNSVEFVPFIIKSRFSGQHLVWNFLDQKTDYHSTVYKATF